MGKHLVLGGADGRVLLPEAVGRDDNFGGGLGVGRSVLDVGLGHHFVDVVHEFDEAAGLAVAGMLETHVEVGADASWVAAEHQDAVGQHDGFFNVVGDDEDGTGGHLLVEPEFQKFAAEVLGRQDIEGGERLIHEKHFRFHDQSAGEADALLHAAGKLLGVSSLEAVQANRVERAQRALAALHGRYAAGFERSLHVFENGKPREKRETLEDDGHVGKLTVILLEMQWLAMPKKRARRRLRKARQNAQQRRLAAARRPEQGHDFPRLDVEVGMAHDLDARAIRLGIGLLDRNRLNDGFAHEKSSHNFYTRCKATSKVVRDY